MTTEAQAVRVLSIPAEHPYVRHAVGPVGLAHHVLLLPDPPNFGNVNGQWHPHPAWEEEWIRTHRHEFDLVHVHFGFEHRSLTQMARWVDLVQAMNIPLVVTVHDLDLPHAVDQSAHQQRLALLVRVADAVWTLTPGAAQRVFWLTGRTAQVLPHPALEAPEVIARTTRPVKPSGRLRVGLHLKSLRANAGRQELVHALVGSQAHIGGDWELEILAHAVVRDPRHPTHDPAVVASLDQAATMPGVVVRWIDPLNDAAFTEYLRTVDVSVLPHRWGTHSGWLEQCHDLGVVPVVPTVGHVVEQGVRFTYDWDGPVPHQESLVQALTGAMAQARGGRSTIAAVEWARFRSQQDACTRAAHRRTYRRLVQPAVASTISLMKGSA